MQIGVRHVRITRRFHFDSAHSLELYDGKCKNLHGHRWTLDVTLEDKVNTETGLAVDFSDIKQTVERNIISKLDHQYLNNIIETQSPTAEVIILWIWNVLKKTYNNSLYSLRLYESPESWIDFDGGV